MSKILILISFILYIGSLLFTAFGCNYLGADSMRYTTATGFELLYMGWMAIFAHNLAWFANITYLLSLIFLIFKPFINQSTFSRHLALVFKYLPVITLLLGLSSLLLYFDKENNQVGLYLGFYLWIASFIILVIAALFDKNLPTKKH